MLGLHIAIPSVYGSYVKIEMMHQKVRMYLGYVYIERRNNQVKKTFRKDQKHNLPCDSCKYIVIKHEGNVLNPSSTYICRMFYHIILFLNGGSSLTNVTSVRFNKTLTDSLLLNCSAKCIFIYVQQPSIYYAMVRM